MYGKQSWSNNLTGEEHVRYVDMMYIHGSLSYTGRNSPESYEAAAVSVDNCEVCKEYVLNGTGMTNI
jgi:hypothetical protein